MDHFNIYDEEELTKVVLYENATFDLKKLLSNETSIWLSAATVITPTQTASFSFMPNYDDYEYNYLQHAFITDLLLSRLYPSYKRTKKRDDQKIYAREGKNNIFILTIESHLAIIIQSNGKINQYQYDELAKFINQAKESEYATPVNKSGKKIFTEFWILKNENEIENEKENDFENQLFVPKDEIDTILLKLREHITEIEPLPQYNIDGFDFSNCQTDEDFMKKSEEYAKNYFNKSNIIYYGQNPSTDDNTPGDDER